jgi:hypothetical protein
MEHEKNREREKKEKNATRVSLNKRGSQYFERRKTLQIQKFFFI